MKKTLLVLLMMTGVGCQSLIKDPKIEVADIKIEKVGPSGATLVFLCDVANPNAFNIKVDELQYKVSVNKNEIGRSQPSTAPIQVKAHTTERVPLSVDFKYADVFNSFFDVLEKRKIDYAITGEARLGALTIPFEKKGSKEIQ